MHATWKQLAFTPSAESVASLMKAWSWLLEDQLSPFLFAASGDVFFEAEDRSIHWLDTGQGALTRIAESEAEFLQEVRNDQGREWLLSPVIDRLLEAGKPLGKDQCYRFTLLPILGGKYTVDNMSPASAGAWYRFTGDVHSQIRDLPDGTHVEFKFEGE